MRALCVQPAKFWRFLGVFGALKTVITMRIYIIVIVVAQQLIHLGAYFGESG